MKQDRCLDYKRHRPEKWKKPDLYILILTPSHVKTTNYDAFFYVTFYISMFVFPSSFTDQTLSSGASQFVIIYNSWIVRHLAELFSRGISRGMNGPEGLSPAPGSVSGLVAKIMMGFGPGSNDNNQMLHKAFTGNCFITLKKRVTTADTD
jgi:hypothetical protein